MHFNNLLHFRLSIFLFSTLFILFPATAFSAFETRLSDTHVQSALVNHFPFREYAAFARVTLNEPQVILSRDSRDMFLVIPVDANIPDQAQKQGHARVAVGFSYTPGNGGLYLFNPRLLELEMPGITKSMHRELAKKIESMIKNFLPLIRVYQVKEEFLNHSLTKSILKSYTINNGFIDLVLGFD